jgi:outer membrane lipoprotein SlyB
MNGLRVRRVRFGVLGAVFAATALASTGCNNAGEGALSGGALGALAGMGLGSLSGNMGKGAAAGAIIGAVGGALIGDQNDRNDRYSSRRGSSHSHGHRCSCCHH